MGVCVTEVGERCIGITVAGSGRCWAGNGTAEGEYAIAWQHRDAIENEIGYALGQQVVTAEKD